MQVQITVDTQWETDLAYNDGSKGFNLLTLRGVVRPQPDGTFSWQVERETSIIARGSYIEEEDAMTHALREAQTQLLWMGAAKVEVA